MLQRGPGGLSSLLIHELSHGFIFVPDSSGLNENLANFIGEEGAKLFLRHKYGPQSGRMQRNLYGKQDSRHYAEHLHRGSLQLDSLYNDPIFIACPTPKKEAAKQQLIDLIFRNLDTVAFSFPDAYCSRPANLNNNYFLSYRTYEFRQNAFRTEFEKLYPGNLPGYIAYLRKKYGGPNS